MSIPAYLILGTPDSGRRELCVDVCKNAFDGQKVVVLVSENEPACACEQELAACAQIVKYNVDAFEKTAELAPDTDVVLFVADSSENVADSVEEFKRIVDAGKLRLARIWSVVDCKTATEFPKQTAPFFEALSHFADCLMLSRRSGVSNAAVNEFVAPFKKQCKPHLIEYMDKFGRVANPMEIVVEQARRISMLFDEYDPVDELDLDEDNLPEEPFDLQRKPDPYLDTLPNGCRKNPIPDISKFVKLSHEK